eukprot:Gb_24780 [translate_table: standard]
MHTISMTRQWKDLNSKFVLQVYRNLVANGDKSFHRDAWLAVYAAMEYMKRFDKNGDCLIENDGFLDQTYDTWIVQSISASCAVLWLVALQAATTMIDDLGHRDFVAKYKRGWLGALDPKKLLWDALGFNNKRAVLGGHICAIGQGYGLMKTCAGRTSLEWDDTIVGCVDLPFPCFYVKLVYWTEGDHWTSDSPMPQGETVIGSSNENLGYFKNKTKAEEPIQADLVNKDELVPIA